MRPQIDTPGAGDVNLGISVGCYDAVTGESDGTGPGQVEPVAARATGGAECAVEAEGLVDGVGGRAGAHLYELEVGGSSAGNGEGAGVAQAGVVANLEEAVVDDGGTRVGVRPVETDRTGAGFGKADSGAAAEDPSERGRTVGRNDPVGRSQSHVVAESQSPVGSSV